MFLKLTDERKGTGDAFLKAKKNGKPYVFTGSIARENTVHITYLKVSKQQARD